MRNIAAEPPTRPPFPSSLHTDRSHRKVTPAEFADWMEERLPRLVARWHREIQSRYDQSSRGVNGLLEEFLTLLASFLPALLGPHRDQVEPVWIRTSELFGAVAARRGLAAGEVIEELQILREAVIRLLYQEPPLGGRIRLSLREVLRLNRALDTGVTHASVGHTDAMFFSLFEGSGIPDAPPTAELKAELRTQLDGIRAELREILGRVPGERARPSTAPAAEV
jgi:hypothetical protein